MKENQEERHKKIVLFPQDRSLCPPNDTFIPGVPGQTEKQKWPTSWHLPSLKNCMSQKSLPHLRTSGGLLPTKERNDRPYRKKTDAFLFYRVLCVHTIPGHRKLLPDLGQLSGYSVKLLQKKAVPCRYSRLLTLKYAASMRGDSFIFTVERYAHGKNVWIYPGLQHRPE